MPDGEQTYNLTLKKPVDFSGINITEVSGNENVSAGIYKLQEGMEASIVVSLPRGIYEIKGVEGKKNIKCNSQPLKRPIVLEPSEPQYSNITRDSLQRARFEWSLTSDLPVDHFEFTDTAGFAVNQSANNTDATFSLGGSQAPASLYQSVEHKTIYTGIDDDDNPVKTFNISLGGYVPRNAQSEHVMDLKFHLSWAPPAAQPESVNRYRLFITRPSTGSSEFIDFTADSNSSTQQVNLTIPEISPGTEKLLDFLAVYQETVTSKDNEPIKHDWFGPTEKVTFSRPESPTGAPGQPSVPIIIGGVLGGAALLAIPTVATIILAAVCCKKITHAHKLRNPVSLDDNDDDDDDDEEEEEEEEEKNTHTL